MPCSRPILFGALMLSAVATAQPVASLPVEASSSAGVALGSGLGVSGQPQTLRLGLEYDFAIDGPLLLNIGGALAGGADAFVIHLAPGVRYLLPMEKARWMPYGKAALAIDIMSGAATQGMDLAVGLKLGGGLQFFLLDAVAVGPDIAVSFGSASGDGSVLSLGFDAMIGATYRLP